MSGFVTVEPDPDGRAGHAAIRVHGAGQFAGSADFRIRRDDYDEGVFGSHGWQVADELLPPDANLVEGDDLVLRVGPWIVQHMVSGVYHFAIPAAKLETTMFWPDVPLLADGSSNMVAEPARAAPRADPAPRPQIQRQLTGMAQTRESGMRPAPANTTDPPPDETVRLASIPVTQTAIRTPPAPKPEPRDWIPWAVLSLALLIAAGGGYYAYRTFFQQPPVVSGPVPPSATPAVIPSDTAPPSTPATTGPDLQHMSAADALRSGAAPEALLREGQRRMQVDSGQRGDGLLLMQGAADRDYAPAHAALGQLYDPNMTRPPEFPPDPRQAALHYRAAERGGDTSVAAPRAALRTWLEQQAQRNDLFAPLILKEFLAMSAQIRRRSLIAAALALPAAAHAQSAPGPSHAPNQPAAPARPLLIPGKTTLYQRIVTHPGATLAPRPDGQGAQPTAGFEVFYVYARQGGDTGMAQVGRTTDGRTDGWIPAAKTIEWKHTLIGAFTNRAGRQRVLFLNDKDAERDLLLDAHAGDAAGQMVADARAGRPGHVIAQEPDSWANIDDHFYLLPILSADPIEREFGPPLRLLEVISAPMPKAAPPPQEFKAAVVFLVDTTVSMQPYINGTRDVIRQIVGRVRASPMGNSFRFGLVAYRDSLADTPALEYDARVYAKPDFSQPADAILPAIEQVREARASSIGFDEDPIGGLKATIDQIDWDSISAGFRDVVLITDAGARPANHPHSVTGMGITRIKELADSKGVRIWTLHLLTEEGARRDDHAPAARQYKELTALNPKTQFYYPVPEGPPGHFATQADFENQADHLARAVITLAAETSGRPPPDLGPAHGPEPQQLTQQMPIIREAMRLAYLGHMEQATLPEAVRSWTTDRDLADPALTSLGVRVLLTKNQLSDLAQTLKEVLRQGRAGQLEPQSFFAQLQATVASGFRDPREIAHASRVGALLGEFLEDLPYKSTLLETTATEWAQMSAIKRDAIMNGIDDRLSLYAAYDAQPEKWYDLGSSHNPGEAVYPVPIEALP